MPVTAPHTRPMTTYAYPSERPGRLHVLIVDEDAAVRSACCEIAARRGFTPHAVENLATARSLLHGNSVDILLLDLKSPAGPGLQLVEEVKMLHPEMAVIVMTAFATVSSAVEAMRTGADDYLTKPFTLEELAAVLERAGEGRKTDVASRQLRDKLRTEEGLGNIIGRSGEMERLYRILSKVAQTSHPVLILGESGTGKELVARSIHANGPNAARPFLPVDCGSLVPTLIESELFGYVKGAFTGANRSKDGLLACAEGGTVFLDEIGELPLDLQAKLLRALQEKENAREVPPTGSPSRFASSPPPIAIWQRWSSRAVPQGSLLPAERSQSPYTAPARAARGYSTARGALPQPDEGDWRAALSLSDEVLRTMVDYPWPGNVRELENSIERASALSSVDVLHMGDLPTQLRDFHMHAHRAVSSPAAPVPHRESPDAVTPLAEMERQAILRYASAAQGRQAQSREAAGHRKDDVDRKLKEYGLGESLAGL